MTPKPTANSTVTAKAVLGLGLGMKAPPKPTTTPTNALTAKTRISSHAARSKPKLNRSGYCQKNRKTINAKTPMNAPATPTAKALVCEYFKTTHKRKMGN